MRFDVILTATGETGIAGAGSLEDLKNLTKMLRDEFDLPVYVDMNNQTILIGEIEDENKDDCECTFYEDTQLCDGDCEHCRINDDWTI